MLLLRMAMQNTNSKCVSFQLDSKHNSPDIVRNLSLFSCEQRSCCVRICHTTFTTQIVLVTTSSTNTVKTQFKFFQEQNFSFQFAKQEEPTVISSRWERNRLNQHQNPNPNRKKCAKLSASLERKLHTARWAFLQFFSYSLFRSISEEFCENRWKTILSDFHSIYFWFHMLQLDQVHD